MDQSFMFDEYEKTKTRTFLTILGVVIGVISVVTLLAVGIGVRQEMINTMVDSESICRIQVTGATGGKHKDRMIMDQTVKTFQELEYVSSVYPTYEMYVTITNGKYSYDGAITGIPQSELAKLKYTKTSKQTTSSVKPVLIMGNKVTSLFYNPETEQTYDVTEKKKQRHGSEKSGSILLGLAGDGIGEDRSRSGY